MILLPQTHKKKNPGFDFRLPTSVFCLLISAFCLLVAPAHAQSINFNMGTESGGSTASQIIQMVGLITVLSLAPSIIMMVTSFVRIVVSLSLLRTALGLQQTPPNMVIISLALFLTFFIMTPTFNKAYEDGIKPMMDQKIEEKAALPLIIKPFHDFMIRYTREKDLKLFMDMAKKPADMKADDIPLHVLIPAFMISELRRAFEIGFMLFLPFLIIDMVVSSILLAMGMMMLPPSVVALPFKIIFFVLVDGWYLVVGSLVKSYGTV